MGETLSFWEESHQIVAGTESLRTRYLNGFVVGKGHNFQKAVSKIVVDQALQASSGLISLVPAVQLHNHIFETRRAVPIYGDEAADLL